MRGVNTQQRATGQTSTHGHCSKNSALVHGLSALADELPEHRVRMSLVKYLVKNQRTG